MTQQQFEELVLINTTLDGKYSDLIETIAIALGFWGEEELGPCRNFA